MTLNRYIKWLYFLLVLSILVFIQIGIRTGERPDMRSDTPGDASFKPMAQKIKESKDMMKDAEDRVIQSASLLLDQPSDEMILIPSGSFTMGNNEGPFDEQPEHEVFVDRFYLDPYEVTFAHFYAFVSATNHRKPRLAGYLAVDSTQLHTLLQPDNAVAGVSWYDAQAYCEWKEKRLPTEAEWEKVATGSNQTQWPWGNEEEPSYANLIGLQDGYPFLSPVGAFKQDRSPSGVFDLAGNVMEWVSDWYQEDYYRQSPARNPTGPEVGRFRVGPDREGFKVIRGASWNDSIRRAVATIRFKAYPSYRDVTIGFRCAKTL